MQLVRDKIFDGQRLPVLEAIANISSDNPSYYKVIDLKPMFGVLFKHHLRHFKFWGHCDNDLIFGDLRKFLYPKLLEANDVLSPMKPKGRRVGKPYLRTWGPLTVYRPVSHNRMMHRRMACTSF